MDLMKVIYFFCNMRKSSFWTIGSLHDGKTLFMVFILTILVVLFCGWYFYYRFTLSNVKKNATRGNFYKFYFIGLLICFILTETVFATTSKMPNSNILTPIIGKQGDVIAFSLINLLYFSLCYAGVTYILKSNSKNAKGIWFV